MNATFNIIKDSYVGGTEAYYDFLDSDTALGLRDIGIDVPKDQFSRLKYEGILKRNELINQARDMANKDLMAKKGLEGDLANLGKSELFLKAINGEISWDDYTKRISHDMAYDFGSALPYMIPIGRAGRALSKAKRVLDTAKAGVRGKVARGAGVLTSEAAAAARRQTSLQMLLERTKEQTQ